MRGLFAITNLCRFFCHRHDLRSYFLAYDLFNVFCCFTSLMCLLLLCELIFSSMHCEYSLDMRIILKACPGAICPRPLLPLDKEHVRNLTRMLAITDHGRHLQCIGKNIISQNSIDHINHMKRRKTCKQMIC